MSKLYIVTKDIIWKRCDGIIGDVFIEQNKSNRSLKKRKRSNYERYSILLRPEKTFDGRAFIEL